MLTEANGGWRKSTATGAIRFERENNGERLYLAVALGVLAECLGLQGRWLEAREKAEEALIEAQPYSSMTQSICQVDAALSFVHTGELRRGSELLAAARECVDKVLGLAARHNILSVFLTHFEMLQPVLQSGLENGVEVAFVQRVLTRKGERSLPLLASLSSQADPEIRRRTIAPGTEIGGPEAGELIRRLIDDPDAEVRQAAQLAARRRGLIESAGVDLEPSATPLQLATLGSFRVFLQGIELGRTSWRTTKTRDLLAYLVHQEEPVSKERILKDLWPDTDPNKATIIFRTTLYNLRKVLNKADCLTVANGAGRRYQLQPGGFTSDRQRFQELVAAGLRRDTAPKTATALLEQAVALHRGDYLEGLDYSWLLPHQEYLKNLLVKARLRLARYYLEARDYVQAIAHLRIAEEYEPFLEDVHTLLMTAYARQGNRTAVKTQYEKMRAVLKKELGLKPSRTVQDLYLKLMA